MPISQEQLIAFLLDGGLATDKQIEQAQKDSAEKGVKVSDALVAKNVISRQEILKLQAYILGIPFVNVEKQKVPEETLKIIPEAIARKHNIVAYRKQGNNLEVAMIDPEDLQTIDFIKKTSNLKILPRLTSENGIKNVLQQYQKSLQAEFNELIDKEPGPISLIKEKGNEVNHDDLLKAAQELPIIKIVDTLLKHGILGKASDIHIEPTEKEVVVRYRIDGILHDAMILPLQVAPGLVARIKVLSNLKLDEHRLPQDGRFKIETDDYRVAFRVSILPVYDGEKIVMRLLPETNKALNLEELGFRGRGLESVRRHIDRPHGMILITGPTGSGKTTTLYSMMNILNKPSVNISTIEDPIEYRMPRINQTQVKADIGLSFSNGLRSLVRQDPDILMVGEIRDKETANLAVNAALTGHLVLSTLHTNDAASAMPRLIDMGAEPFLIASTLNCVIAQRLVRQLNPTTKQNYNLSKSAIESLKKQIDLDKLLTALKDEKVVPHEATWSNIDFYKPVSTTDCSTGYQGRIGIFEVLETTPEIHELIIKEASSDQINQKARQNGMLSMLEEGFIKTIQGVTSLEEILRVTQE